MPLNKQKGNMYDWITHTWNTVKGMCPHSCHYCYMKKRGPQKPIRFDEKELKTDLGEGNFIFVGSSSDMFASEIPFVWITATLAHCEKYQKNRYLFQSKNPAFIHYVRSWLPRYTKGVTIGTTIETNRTYPEMGNAPIPQNRAYAIRKLKEFGLETMITIEPIMDFDVEEMVDMIGRCQPKWVNIGANSWHKVKLPEPSLTKIDLLIESLRMITEVKLKPNLKRLGII